jgi:hypothetical protein
MKLVSHPKGRTKIEGLKKLLHVVWIDTKIVYRQHN